MQAFLSQRLLKPHRSQAHQPSRAADEIGAGAVVGALRRARLLLVAPPAAANNDAAPTSSTPTPQQAKARSRWALFRESRGEAEDAAETRAQRLAATDGGLAAARRAAADDADADAKPAAVLVEAAGSTPTAPRYYRLHPDDAGVLPPRAYDTDELLDGLDGVDTATSTTPTTALLGRPPATVPGVPAPADAAEVPAFRRVLDPDELELVGSGLPLPTGGGVGLTGATRGRDRSAHGGAPEWPEAYRGVLTALRSGDAVPVPLPHPKFALSDLERLKSEGGKPRWGDVVLEHAERVGAGGAGAAGAAGGVGEAWRFVPATVLGDLELEVEPDWSQLPRMSSWDFWQALRKRNWTDARAFDADAQPWRVQFFECAHGPASVTRWPGRRAVVTPLERRSRRPLEDRRFWVDLPEAGAGALFDADYKFAASAARSGADVVLRPKRQPAAALAGAARGDAAAAASARALPAEVGWRQAYEQVFAAFEQRAPREAVEALMASGGVPAGTLPYDCPGERLLEVSWHQASAVGGGGPLAAFFARPSFGGAARIAGDALLSSGLVELRYAKDLLVARFMPEIKPPEIRWDPANAGPAYFALVLTLGVVVPAMRRSRILDIKTLEEDPGAAQEFARSKAEARKEGLTGVEFSDVAGLDPILNEVLEVVDFLKDPKAYSALGARPPKGILFEGDPGTGKTLLAKALAGEAMVPFYQMAGTEFTEGIVGVGAARVRDLFKRARAAAPCVIFVDEIDALGLRRAKGENKANEEREQTLNQLLTEMDGFTPDVGVVFLAATNRADLLDPALMRPGRFDRKVHMPRPDTMGRYDILRLQLRGRPVSRDVDLQQLARDLPGLAGADLANVINEAALHAVRCGRGDPSEPLTLEDIYAGVDRYALGETRPALPTSSKVPVLGCCAREVGICLVAGALRRASGRIEQVERVSIVPKGRSLSRTMYARGHDEQYAFLTRGHLLDRIKLALAPAVAARVVFGEDTNFARAGIVRATRLADKMVHYFGLSDMGVTTWAFKPYAQRTVKRGKLKARPNKVVSMGALMAGAEWASKGEDWRFGPFAPSDVTVHRYGDEVARIVRECYDEVWELVQRRRRALWAGIEALAQRREMQGRELRAIFERYPADVLLASEEAGGGGGGGGAAGAEGGASVPRLALGGEEALRMSAEAEEARQRRRERRAAAGGGGGEGSDDEDSSDDDEEEDEALLQAAAELAAARPQQLDVIPFTKGRTDAWPFGIEWLDDAVARPYWVRYREAAERIARETGLPESDAEVQRRAAQEAAAACPGHRESDGRDRLTVGASLPGGSAERAAQVAAMFGGSPGPGYKSERRLE